VYVQFRDGRYEVFNKQATDVRLGGEAILQGRSAAWEPSSELVVSGRRLRLEVEGDPTPAPRPDEAVARPVRRPTSEAESRPRPSPDEAERPRAKPSAEGRGQGVKLLITGACVAASALMLFKDRLPLGKAVAPATAVEDFTPLVAEAFGEAAGSTDGAANLRQRLARRLQSAEASWLTGEWKTAGERYAALKRYLDSVGPDGDASHAAWRSRLVAHVDLRLAALATQRPTRGAQQVRR
jgi:hypothetical protein